MFGAEYKGKASEICANLNNMGLSFIRTDKDVHGGSIVPCCQFANPPCPFKDYRCVAPPSDYPVFPDDSSALSLLPSFILSLGVVSLLAVL